MASWLQHSSARPPSGPRRRVEQEDPRIRQAHADGIGLRKVLGDPRLQGGLSALVAGLLRKESLHVTA